MKTILLKTAELKYEGNGILIIKLLEDAEIDLAASKEMQRASLEITEGKKFVALIDARNRVIVTKEAREWGSTPEAQVNLLAQAILTNSLANRIIGNFIIRFHKPVAKTKLFTEEKEAMKWLRQEFSLFKSKT